MIHINRNQNDKNGNPIRPPIGWFENAEDATNHAIREQGDHEADEKIYGHDLVRAALEKLFYHKCAYCRSDMTAVSDWNVEHFRPKGRVAERSDHPGYYWLTYNWENLYPACTFCNQRRRDKPIWGDLKYATTGGKLDQFPLEDEDTRAMSHHDDINQEKILLIDPCNDNPEEYLSYDIKGQIYALNDNSRGEATINICNLKRRRLRDRREDIIKATVDFLNLLHKQESMVGNNSLIQEFMDWLNLHLLDDNCEYAGVARAVVNDPDAFGVNVN